MFQTPQQFQTKQSTQQNEDRYGNETKRRRLDDAGAHLKVWRMCEFKYIIKPEQLEDPVPEMYEVEVHHDEVHQEVHQEDEALIERFAALEINDQEANDQETELALQTDAVPEVQGMPIQVLGRRVVIYTTDNETVRGIIQTLFDLNGERSIQIQTSSGENLVFTSSQIAGLEVLLNPNEEQLSPIASHEVILIDDASDNEDNDDADSDASTQAPDQDDQDDFPDVEFMPSNPQPQQPHPQHPQPQEEEEHDCCAICFDATDAARNFVSLDCGHQFHFACIMGNMANGGANRNQCPMCRETVVQHYDVHNVENEESMNDMIERFARNNQRLQDELDLNRQHRADLTEEYVRVMGMNLQINARHREERAARDALERRAEICILNERIAQVVAAAANNDIRQNYYAGGRVHMERQIRDLCMSFGMMAYDMQYDDQEQYQGEQGDQDQGEDNHEIINVEDNHEIINVD